MSKSVKKNINIPLFLLYIRNSSISKLINSSAACGDVLSIFLFKAYANQRKKCIFDKIPRGSDVPAKLILTVDF